MTNTRLEAYDRLRSIDLDHTTPAELERLYRLALTLLPAAEPIHAATDRVPLRRKIEGALRVFEINQWRLDARYRPRLRALREAFRGRDRCFVIGDGSSLDAMDLSPLKHEATFAVDGFFLRMPDLDWSPTFYVVDDHRVAEDHAPLIHAIEGPTKLFPAALGSRLDEAPDTIFFDHRPQVGDPDGFDGSTDAVQTIHTGGGVIFTALQLAHLLGFRSIHLVGVDAADAIPRDAAATAPTGRRIVNSSVGGRLEGFEREPFESLFPTPRAPQPQRPAPEPRLAGTIQPADLAALCRSKLAREGRAGRSFGPGWGGAAAAGFPRVLLIDSTAIGDGSSAGEATSTLLGGWPSAELTQVFAADQSLILRQGGRYDVRAETDAPTEALVPIVLAFAPDIILYRPTSDQLRLRQLLLGVLAERPIPVLPWIMDNRMDELRSEQPEQFALDDEDLRALFRLAPFGLAISNEMAAGLEARYGLPFFAIANGVDLDLFAAMRAKAPPPVEDRLVIRYAGGLHEHMGLDTLAALARAVETLSSEFDVRLEISARDDWRLKSAHRFAGFSATKVMAQAASRDDRLAWLCGGDVVVICCDFDEPAKAYVQNSIADTLPEGLASGAVVLAIGPDAAATMKAMRSARAGVAIGTADEDAIAAHLEHLLDIGTRAAIAAHQLTVAEARYDSLMHREALRQALNRASRSTVDRASTRDLVRRSRLSPWTADAPARTIAAPEPAL